MHTDESRNSDPSPVDKKENAVRIIYLTIFMEETPFYL